MTGRHKPKLNCVTIIIKIVFAAQLTAFKLTSWHELLLETSIVLNPRKLWDRASRELVISHLELRRETLEQLIALNLS